MTADELRALAETLEHECALRLIAGGKNHEEAQACEQAADYLRAQADALPVGVYEHRSAEMRYGVRWLVDELPDGTPLYAYPAPAAPQAEQPIDLDAVAMQQMRQAAAESTWLPAEYSGGDWISDVCRWLRDGPPQPEPKREPLSDERITSVCLSYRHDFGLLDDDEQARLMLEARAWERAFRKEWQR